MDIQEWRDKITDLTLESSINTGHQRPLKIKLILERLGYTFADQEITGNDAIYLYTKENSIALTHNVDIFGYGEDTITINQHFG